MAAFAVVALTACGGGGGDSGTSVFSDGTGTGPNAPVATDLVLVLSKFSVPNDASETVTATVWALDANRNTMSNVPVTVRVDANATATPSGTVTNTEGQVTATMGIGSDRTNRTITVTATSGSLTRTASFQVLDPSSVGSVTPSELVLTLSSASIPNTGSQSVTATVTALDAKRNVLPGAPVSFTVDANAIVAPSGTVTGANGTLTGAVGIGGDRSNRTITVTAMSGTVTRTATLQVTDAVVVTAPTAADLSLVLSANRLDNGGSSNLVATATAVDANRNALAGIPVTIRVDSSAVAVTSGTVTNSQGVLTASVGIGSDRTNRLVTVTATSGTLTRTASFSVEGAKLLASFAPRVNVGSTGNSIEYSLVDGNSLPMPDQQISVAGAGLPGASGKTDGNGKYLFSYAAPSCATPPCTLTVSATSAGASRDATIEVASGSIDPAPMAVQSGSVVANPSVVTVNQAGKTDNQVELRALFLGANNQPVPRVRVRFDLDGNANNTDGVVQWLGGSYAYSDSSGVARATFTPGQRSSPTNGVTVRICYDVADFNVATCPNAARTTLTVVQEALAISIRTNELIKEGAAKLTYIKEYVVMVVDAAGNAKPDVLITPSVDLTAYYKGYYTWNGLRWVQNMRLATTEAYQWQPGTRQWANVGPTSQPMCPQEDVNRNGVREASAYSATVAAPALSAREEDLNWNGELDVRKSDVAIKMVGSSKTDANGLAIVQIEYGKDLGTWVDYVITVTASGISGTEARARYMGQYWGNGNLPVPGDAVSDQNKSPAFIISPYGTATVCTSPN